jgi:hypothetical protein
MSRTKRPLKKTANQIAIENGIKPKTLYARMKRTGLSAEEAVKTFQEDKPNVYQLALKSGLLPGTVYARLRKGLSLEQALNDPLHHCFKGKVNKDNQDA